MTQKIIPTAEIIAARVVGGTHKVDTDVQALCLQLTTQNEHRDSIGPWLVLSPEMGRRLVELLEAAMNPPLPPGKDQQH